MGTPTAGTEVQGHFSSVLSKIAFDLHREVAGYVYPLIFPIVPVDKIADNFLVFNDGAVSLDVEDAVDDLSPAPLLENGKPSPDGYRLIRRRRKTRVPMSLLENEDPLFQSRRRGTIRVVRTLDKGTEKRVHDLIMTTSNYTSGHYGAPSVKFDDPSCDIEKQLDTADAVVYAKKGMHPNTLVMGRSVWDAIKYHPRIQKIRDDALKLGAITEATAIPPMLFGRRLVVADSHYNSANPGQTASLAQIYSEKQIALLYVAPADEIGIDTMTMGVVFQGRMTETGGLVTDPLATNGQPIPIYERDLWPSIGVRAVELEGQTLRQEKIVDKDCGYLYTTAIS